MRRALSIFTTAGELGHQLPAFSLRPHAIFLTFLLAALGSTAWAEEATSCATEVNLSQIVAIVDGELAGRLGSAKRPLAREVEIQRVGCEYIYTEWQDLEVVGAWFGVIIADDGKVAQFEYGH